MGTVVPLSTDQYHAILQATPDGFAVLSRDGQILDVNDAYCDLTGYRRKELLRMRLQDLVAGDGFREARPAIESILAGGKAKFELSSSRSPNNLYLNRDSFSAPAPLKLGTGAKKYGNVRGFGTISENLTLTKSHRITEKVRFQLRGELLNLFNRHSLGGISGDINNPNFGYATSVSGNRQVQVSARVDF